MYVYYIVWDLNIIDNIFVYIDYGLWSLDSGIVSTEVIVDNAFMSWI